MLGECCALCVLVGEEARDGRRVERKLQPFGKFGSVRESCVSEGGDAGDAQIAKFRRSRSWGPGI